MKIWQRSTAIFRKLWTDPGICGCHCYQYCCGDRNFFINYFRSWSQKIRIDQGRKDIAVGSRPDEYTFQDHASFCVDVIRKHQFDLKYSIFPKPATALLLKKKLRLWSLKAVNTGRHWRRWKRYHWVFHTGDRSITSLMTHRTDIVWVDAKDSDWKHLSQNSQEVVYSTFPVCDGSIDDIKGACLCKGPGKDRAKNTIGRYHQTSPFVPERTIRHTSCWRNSKHLRFIPVLL